MKTLAERTGLCFTKRRPRKLPDPPYVLAHCRAGWFVLHGDSLRDAEIESRNPWVSITRPYRPSYRVNTGGVLITLCRDSHYKDGRSCFYVENH